MIVRVDCRFRSARKAGGYDDLQSESITSLRGNELMDLDLRYILQQCTSG